MPIKRTPKEKTPKDPKFDKNLPRPSNEPINQQMIPQECMDLLKDENKPLTIKEQKKINAKSSRADAVVNSANEKILEKQQQPVSISKGKSVLQKQGLFIPSNPPNPGNNLLDPITLQRLQEDEQHNARSDVKIDNPTGPYINKPTLIEDPNDIVEPKVCYGQEQYITFGKYKGFTVYDLANQLQFQYLQWMLKCDPDQPRTKFPIRASTLSHVKVCLQYRSQVEDHGDQWVYYPRSPSNDYSVYRLKNSLAEGPHILYAQCNSCQNMKLADSLIKHGKYNFCYTCSQ